MKRIFFNPFFIIAGVSIIVYFQTIFFGLVFLDDFDIISHPLSNVLNYTSIKDILFSKYLGGHYYRPLTLLSFFINAKIAGELPWIYHLTNVLIHTLTAVILYKILIRLNYSGTLSLLSTLLFTVHPIFINAVAWIAGRNDLLVGLFCLTAFLFLLRYIENKNWSELFFYLIFSLLSFISKESAVFFPAVCIVFYFLSKTDKIIKSKDTAFFIVSVSSVLLYFLMRSFISSSVSIDKFSFEAFFKNLRILPETISKVFFPVNLKVLPDFDFWVTASGIIFFILLLIIPFFNKKINRKIYWFGILWFITIMFPGMLVVTMDIDGGYQYWDCRAYLPVVGFFISLIEVVSKVKIEFTKKVIVSLASIIIIIFSFTAIQQSMVYKDPVTFWRSAINDYPRRALYYEGLYSYYDYTKQYKNALKAIKTSLKLNPDHLDYYTKTADLYIRINKQKEAKEIIDNALKRFPDEVKLIDYQKKIKQQTDNQRKEI